MKILSTAPSRISLFGGGTDVAPYATLFGGIVISLAISIRQHLTLYSGPDLYEHPYFEIPPNAQKEFYYKILDEYGLNDMHQSSLKSEYDGLIESGLGSSASAAVALLGAINKRLELNLTLDQIAQKAWELETKKIGLFGGKQDQWASAYGGVNVFEISDKVKVTPLARGFIEPLMPSLVLLYTGKNRKSATIQENFKKPTKQQIKALDKIKALAVQAVDPVAHGDYEAVGNLLHEGWMLKKASNKLASTEWIDDLYKKGINLGALGGKVLGAGGGGFMLFVIDPDKRKWFVYEMGLEEFDFSIDYNGLEVRRLP